MSSGKFVKSIYDHLPISAQNLLCDHRGRKIMRQRFSAEWRRIHSWLLESQWWSHDRLRAYQDEKLRKLILHAYETVPYYRRVMHERGVKPGDIQTAGDLTKLPILTKEIVKREGANMVSTAIARSEVIPQHTSGTTGGGLQFVVNLRAHRFQWAIWWRHRSRFGMELGQAHARFSGQMVVPFRQKRPPFWRRIRCQNSTYLSLYHMTPQNMAAYVEMLESNTFKYYEGYPSAIYLLADYLRSISHRLTNPPEIICTGAESLLPFQVNAFKEWIGAPVVTQQYGLAEGCANCSQCEEGRFHVDMEFAIIEPELVAEMVEGRLCRIIGTSLHNYAMPFIRYDTGDVATFHDEPCPCGRQSDVVKYLDGRVESYVVTPEGRRIGRLDHCFKDMVNIRECQVIQDTVDALEVRIVKAEGYTVGDEKALLGEFRSRLGDRIDIRFAYVEEIPRSKSGKFRAVISRVDDVSDQEGLTEAMQR